MEKQGQVAYRVHQDCQALREQPDHQDYPEVADYLAHQELPEVVEAKVPPELVATLDPRE